MAERVKLERDERGLIKTSGYKGSLSEILLDDVVVRLANLQDEMSGFRRSFDETMPEGRLKLLELSITEAFTELTKTNTPTMPWIAFDIFNDGDDPVHVEVNDREFTTKKAPLHEGDGLRVDMKKPIIEFVRLYTEEAGNTASVRIYALR